MRRPADLGPAARAAATSPAPRRGFFERLFHPLYLGLLRTFVRPAWRNLTLEEVRQRFAHPRRLNTFMQVCFEYTSDADHHGVEEHWQPPALTLASGKGDCEDFALFAWHVLDARRYPAFVLAVFTPEDGHAVCVVQADGRWHTLCNQGLQRTRVRGAASGEEGLREVARHVSDHVYPEGWEVCSIVEDLDLVRDPAARLVPRYSWILPAEGTETEAPGSGA